MMKAEDILAKINATLRNVCATATAIAVGYFCKIKTTKIG